MGTDRLRMVVGRLLAVSDSLTQSRSECRRPDRFGWVGNLAASVMRTQRHVPILSGIFDLAVVLSLFLFWSPESGFWWWMRNGLLTLFLYMGIGSLKRGFFASDTEVARMVAGEYNAKD